jgi:hypothetical protein
MEEFMKRLLVTTNSILAVIAVCLVLLVAKSYGVQLEQSAYAEPKASAKPAVQKVEIVNLPEYGLPVALTNSSAPVTVSQSTPIPVQLWYSDGYNGWETVGGANKALATTR